MSTKITQRDIVLNFLTERGEEGASALEILRLGVYRAAARVAELRASGHSIETKHQAGKTAVYVLKPKTVHQGPAPRIGADPSLWDTIGSGGR